MVTGACSTLKNNDSLEPGHPSPSGWYVMTSNKEESSGLSRYHLVMNGYEPFTKTVNSRVGEWLFNSNNHVGQTLQQSRTEFE